MGERGELPGAPDGDERAIERLLAAAPRPLPLSYAHFAHLRAVAVGTMPTLEGITDDLDVKDAYVRVFDELSALFSKAGSAVAAMCTPRITPAQVLGMLQRCYWLLPHARPQGGDAVSASRLRVQLSANGARLHRQPAQFFPAGLAALTTTQFRAAVATLGFNPTDLVEEARSSVDSSDLARAIETVRAQLVASSPEYAAEFAQLAHDWAGADE